MIAAPPTLADRQQAMIDAILDDEAAQPAGFAQRENECLAIYREAYRARLLDAMANTYERTARWVGEEPFRAAAVHHLIGNPPQSWSIDHAGSGFAATTSELFPGDPEVAELAALEWTMQQAFTAADSRPISSADFAAATSRFGEDDWSDMVITFVAGLTVLPCHFDMVTLWNSLGEGANRCASLSTDSLRLDEPARLIVWREHFRSVFVTLDEHQGQALQLMVNGASFGQACALLSAQLDEEVALEKAGAMLGNCIALGLVQGC